MTFTHKIYPRLTYQNIFPKITETTNVTKTHKNTNSQKKKHKTQIKLTNVMSLSSSLESPEKSFLLLGFLLLYSNGHGAHRQ